MPRYAELVAIRIPYLILSSPTHAMPRVTRTMLAHFRGTPHLAENESSAYANFAASSRRGLPENKFKVSGFNA